MAAVPGAEMTTDLVLGDISLDGVRAIVTGASTGLGEETARALASRGAKVTLAVRDQARSETAVARIRQNVRDARLDVGVVDLAEPESVLGFAQSWLAKGEPLNLLINNAGLMACPLMRNSLGWEMQLATN